MKAIEKMQREKQTFLDFVFAPIEPWSPKFLSKITYCMILSNSGDRVKKNLETDSIRDGISFAEAFRKCVFSPLSELMALTALQNFISTVALVGREGYACVFVRFQSSACVFVRFQQSSCRNSTSLDEMIGRIFDELDQEEKSDKTPKAIWKQQFLLEVFELGTIILDGEEQNVYFQSCETGEWAMRDICTAMLNHSLPHVNHAIGLFNYMQRQDTRTRLILYAYNIMICSVSFAHQLTNLAGGIPSPSFIFSQLFGANQWGVKSAFRVPPFFFHEPCFFFRKGVGEQHRSARFANAFH